MVRNVRFLFAWLFVLAAMPVMMSCGDDDDNDSHKNVKEVSVGEISTEDVVDLGLSVFWASCNLGAENPWEYGNYYAWGETEPKDWYDWDTYKWCKGSYQTLTKYNTKEYTGIVDNKTVLEPSDDAAHVKLGGNWRMPTRKECEELISKCTWKWVKYHDIEGFKVTGPNDKAIFLPAAGYRWYDKPFQPGYGLYYSSSTLSEYQNSDARYIGAFFEDVARSYVGSRSHGKSIRPVCQE